MWWLIPLAIGGAAYLISKSLETEARGEYERWQSTYTGVQQQVHRHTESINQHVWQARQTYNFHESCELHYQSMKLADEAHKLLRDAGKSKDAIGKAISAIKGKMDEVYRAAKQTGIGARQREELHRELAELKSLKQTLYRDLDEMTQQVMHFAGQVRKLNQKTRELKLKIRDNCGSKGKEWFDRLETRTVERRARESEKTLAIDVQASSRAVVTATEWAVITLSNFTGNSVKYIVRARSDQVWVEHELGPFGRCGHSMQTPAQWQIQFHDGLAGIRVYDLPHNLYYSQSPPPFGPGKDYQFAWYGAVLDLRTA